jgi:hypothetical protein
MLKKVQNMLMKVLNHQLVLVALVLLSVLNVVGYGMVRSYNCLGIFAGTAVVVRMLTKHNALALLGAIFVANFVFGCSKVKEGMEDKKENENEGEDEEKKGGDALGDIMKQVEKLGANMPEMPVA